MSGSFGPGSVIALKNSDGVEIARGLSNYHASEIEKILGVASDQISNVLGYQPYETVVHRDNLVISDLAR